MSENPVSNRVSRLGVGLASILAFSCGVILLYRLATLPPYPWLFVLVGLMLLAMACRYQRIQRLGPVVVAATLGLVWAGWNADMRLAERLPSEWETKRIVVSGYLCDLPTPGSFDSLRFGFCVLHWQAPGVSVDNNLPRVLRLSWYGREGRRLPDHRLTLEVTLKRPQGNLNPDGFRYEDWLFRHGYRATGSVKQVSAAPELSCALQCQYHAWHWRASKKLQRWFGEAEYYPLIASLLMGNRGSLEDHHWQVLKSTGTIHLVAISGLHLGLVAVGVGLLARWGLLLLPVGGLSEQGRRSLVFLVVVLSCLVYSLLAGFTVPTRRALVMVVAGGWYLLKARQQSGWRPFVLALAVVLLMDPFAPLDQGFWLSFGAVGVLLAVFSGRLGSSGWLSALLIAQLAVFVGLWPMLMLVHQGQPFAGFAANLLAVPWVSFAVMPVLFLGAIIALFSGGWLLPWVSAGFDLVLGALWWWLELVARFPAGQMQPLPLPLAAGLALLALWGIRWRDWRWRALLGVTFLLLSVPWSGTGVGNSVARAPEVRVLDVGQGLSVVVRAGGRVMVYDTGPEVTGVYSAADSVLVPNLRAMGVEVIDLLVLSHADNDHAGGLETLSEHFAIKRVISGEPALITGRVPVTVEGCRPGNIRWPGLVMSLWQNPLPADGNDASCVIRVYHPSSNSDFVLTGDISRKVEQLMLGGGGPEWLENRVAQRVVLAPHHGSKTSSSTRWVQAVAPDQVIYTAGYRHHFGHPHAEVTGRYRASGAVPLNTACSGQITLRFADSGLLISELWQTQPFWIASPGLARSECKIP